jgi:hypothetical protein
MPLSEHESLHGPPPAYEALLEAVERGRAGRIESRAREWAHVRALVLALTFQGLSRVRIGGSLSLSTQRITQLREEACEAVLRGGAESLEADTVCAATWTRWCEVHGDADAFQRVQSIPSRSID